MVLRDTTDEAVAALARLAELWRARLDSDWSPPTDSPFPWAQVRLSLAALLPGMRGARAWVERASLSPSVSPSPPRPLSPSEMEKGGVSESESLGFAASRSSTVPETPPFSISDGERGRGGEGYPRRAEGYSVAIILAGNTPLLAWSPLCACLLAGVNRVRVKLSRDETVWTRLFVESLAEVAPEVAARIELYDFPGADERTYALLSDADAVIAYGSDSSIAALQKRTPPGVPFFSYGHAVALGVLTGDVKESADGYARDVLMYDQAGCLSPHIIYCARLPESGSDWTRVVSRLFGTHFLGLGMMQERLALAIKESRSIGDALAVRQARDIGSMDGHIVIGDNSLWWTTITATAIPYPEPVGRSVVYVSPVESPEQLRELLKPVWGIVSCAGVAGKLTPEWEAVLKDAGVSRFCKPGEMQTPPLDWQNGNRDLLAELLHRQTY